MSDKRFSIFTNDLTKCFICGSCININKHEIYFGSNRNNSIKYGLVVSLCKEHHQGTEGVHGSKGNDLNKYLKKLGQAKFEEVYPDLDFREIFGKNYL